MWIFEEEEGTGLLSDHSNPRSLFEASLTRMSYHGLLHILLPSTLGKNLKGTVHYLWAFVWKARMDLKKAKTGILIPFLLMLEQKHIVCPIWRRIQVVETIRHAPSSLSHATLLGNAQRSYRRKQMSPENLGGTRHTAQQSFWHFHPKEIMQKKVPILP